MAVPFATGSTALVNAGQSGPHADRPEWRATDMRSDFTQGDARSVGVVTAVSLLADSSAEDLNAELRYDLSDPFAIRMNFIGAGSGSVQWTFARDLLIDGLSAPTGEGDVRIMPAMDCVIIDLISPHGRARLLADRGEIATFVAHTLAQVPRGEEHLESSIGAELDLLLGSGVPGSTEQ